jgi:hypothetical protein
MLKTGNDVTFFNPPGNAWCGYMQYLYLSHSVTEALEGLVL